MFSRLHPPPVGQQLQWASVPQLCSADLSLPLCSSHYRINLKSSQNISGGCSIGVTCVVHRITSRSCSRPHGRTDCTSHHQFQTHDGRSARFTQHRGVTFATPRWQQQVTQPTASPSCHACRRATQQSVLGSQAGPHGYVCQLLGPYRATCNNLAAVVLSAQQLCAKCTKEMSACVRTCFAVVHLFWEIWLQHSMIGQTERDGRVD